LFLSEAVPSDVYHSCAYYENPEADMDKKGWLGADLVFDIDADHIPTSCDKIHDEWICGTCHLNGRGVTPEICPACGGQKLDTKTWPCERCIDSAKDETTKLIDMLAKDFGLSERDLHVFFSGHRGYHVHVETEAIRTLDSMARKEMVDYVTGLGLNLSRREKAGSDGKAASRTFGLHEFGRYGRLKQDMRNFIELATKDDLVKAGIKGGASTAILQYKQQVLERCIGKGLWDSVRGIGDETWFKIAAYLTNLQIAAIDTVVTTDIHRLIRMNGTLHGKTGLKKIEFPVGRLPDFDPFKEAVAFKEGAVKVFVSGAPEFRLGGNVLGPYKNLTVELPTAAAVLLICKGRAEVAS
jgi:DNA primase small subunit